MPTVPKWLANGMEKVFSGMMQPVEVSEIEYLDKRLKRVRFSGDLSKTKFTAGDAIEFRIDDTNFRHYTPSFYDKSDGICEVLFYLHGYGIGSDWANDLKVGDRMKLMGPGGKMKFKEEARQHFCFGDETSLGVCLSFQTAVQQAERKLQCLLELEPTTKNWVNLIQLDTEIVEKSKEKPAKGAIEWLDEQTEATWGDWQDSIFYLTGRAKSIQVFRKALINKGVNAKQIQRMPYWAEGKKGL
ncbi:MAG: siderophore-interacting protein [Bacteroidota bacterium]